MRDIVFDPAQPEVSWETGIRGSGGLYTSTDSGATYLELGKLTFTQTVSIDFSDEAAVASAASTARPMQARAGSRWEPSK